MKGSYQDLFVWKKAIELTVRTYRLTDRFPKEERFGLSAQMRRAAVSIPSNIAEGQGRISKGEWIQFLGHARGSLHELETQVVVATALEFVSDPEASALLSEFGTLGRALNRLIQAIRAPNR